MITLEKEITPLSMNVLVWNLRAYGARTPYIAEITGFSKEFNYQREFRGQPFAYRAAWWVIREYGRPILLDIRHDSPDEPWPGRWYILHGTDFDNLQLTEVSRGAIDTLLSEPLFTRMTYGSPGCVGRIFDDVAPPPGKKQKDMQPAIVAQSPVDAAPKPPTPRARIEAMAVVAENDFPPRLPRNPVLYVDMSGEKRDRRGFRITEKRKKKAAAKELPPILPHSGRRKFSFDD